jgi:Spy/CpxP family protein refolding chaperone
VTKAKIIIGLAFLVTFLAGIAAGIALKPASRPPAQGSWLDRELGLTKEQRDQMRAIWTEVMRDGGRPQSSDKRREYQKARDDAVRGLVPAEKQPQYEAAMQEYARKTAELGKERERAFQEAVERTKKILNDEQRRKYEEMLKNRFDRDRHRSGGASRETGRPAERPPAEAAK